MDLDNQELIRRLDPKNMLGEIDGLPKQLEQAWQLGHKQPPVPKTSIRQVIISGMGGSAIGADLLAAYIEDKSRLPVLVQRDYHLPAWANGPETLLIASSHSGNTEETLAAFNTATERGCLRLAVTTGGKLAQAAQESQATLWQFDHQGQPRAAVGYSFGLLLAAFARLELIPDPSRELDMTIHALEDRQKEFGPEVPVTQNPAKRQAGQLIDRYVTIIASGSLGPVARRWKGQISELAKAWAQFEFLPEADHNTLAGIHNPEARLNELIVMFLSAPTDHPRNQLRSELTRKTLMLQGIGTDMIRATTNSTLANQWILLHFGDYMAYYLAIAYGYDPTPVESIESFKREMLAADH